MLQKKVFLSPGNWNGTAVGHLDIPSFMPDVFLDMFEIDEVRIMRTEEITAAEQSLVFLQVP
jgi:hypothetical protein